MALTIVVDLDVKRAAAAAVLQRTIEDLANPTLSAGDDPYNGVSCPYRSFSMYSYFRELQRCSLWPLSEVFRQSNLSTISQRILSFKESNSTLLSTDGTKRLCRCSVCQMRFKPLIESAREAHLCTITGLCLDCVKAGGSKTEYEGGNCRIAHCAAL